jgi:iron-sulfur cluster assembly accessory protein
MIKLTEQAVLKLKEFADAEGIENISIRVKVYGGGCSGFGYDINFDDKFTELDDVSNFEDIKILVDPISLQYLNDVVIDFEDRVFGAGFKFINPSETGSCGCGKSVKF